MCCSFQLPHADCLYSETIRVLIAVSDGFPCTRILGREHQKGPPLPLNQLSVDENNRVIDEQSRRDLSRRFSPLLMQGDYYGDQILEFGRPVTSQGIYHCGDVLVFSGDLIHWGPALPVSPTETNDCRVMLFMTINPKGLRLRNDLQLHGLLLAQYLYGAQGDHAFEITSMINKCFPDHYPKITILAGSAFAQAFEEWSQQQQKQSKRPKKIGF